MVTSVAILIAMAVVVVVTFIWLCAHQKQINLLADNLLAERLDKLSAVLESMVDREMKTRLSEVDSSLKDVAGLLDEVDDDDPKVRAIKDPLVRHICGLSKMVEDGSAKSTYDELSQSLDHVGNGIGEVLEDVRQIIKDEIADGDVRT